MLHFNVQYLRASGWTIRSFSLLALAEGSTPNWCGLASGLAKGGWALPLVLIGGSGCGLTHAGPGFFRTSRPTGERDGFQLLRLRVPYEYPVGLTIWIFLFLSCPHPPFVPHFAIQWSNPHSCTLIIPSRWAFSNILEYPSGSDSPSSLTPSFDGRSQSACQPAQSQCLDHGVRSLHWILTIPFTDCSPGIPWVGRVHDTDVMAPWKKMKEFSDEFNGFFQTEIMGDTHLWLGDHKISQELFGNRSRIYSSRPEVPAVPGSDTQGQYLPLMEYAGKSRVHSLVGSSH